MNFPLGVLFVDRRPLKIIRTSVKNLLKLFFFIVYNTYSFLFLSKHLNKYLAKKLIMTETSEAIQIGELEFWEMYKPVFSKLKTPARPYKLLIFQQEVINQALQFLTKRKYNPRLCQIAIRSTAKIMDLSSDEEKEMGAILHDLGKREFQYQEASKYVAPPEIIPPHSTGGAVDLTLVGEDEKEIDMGTRLNADPEESNNACFTLAANISDSARTNRQLLINTMSKSGFVNYPTEWWHWS